MKWESTVLNLTASPPPPLPSSAGSTGVDVTTTHVRLKEGCRWKVGGGCRLAGPVSLSLCPSTSVLRASRALTFSGTVKGRGRLWTIREVFLVNFSMHPAVTPWSPEKTPYIRKVCLFHSATRWVWVCSNEHLVSVCFSGFSPSTVLTFRGLISRRINLWYLEDLLYPSKKNPYWIRVITLSVWFVWLYKSSVLQWELVLKTLQQEITQTLIVSVILC